MAIQIIDNFSLNANKPIDTRFVVGGGNFYAIRNDIPNDRRYPGLRIWDLNDNAPLGIPYVWDGTSWVNENTSGVSGSGTLNRISKFTSTGGSIGDSQIFDNGTNVGIGTITPTNKLSVSGDVSANNFIGNGSQIISLNINSSNVTGKIGLNNLPNGTNSHILQSLGSSTEWVAQSTLSVGNATTATTATNANNVNIQSTTTNGNNHYMLFSTTTGNQQIRTRIDNQSIRINPSTGNIGIGTSTMNNKLTISGNVSVGSTITAPTNGLRVQGETFLNNKTRITANVPGALIIVSPSNNKRFEVSQLPNYTSLSTSNNTMFIITNAGDPPVSGGEIIFGGSDAGPTGNKIIMSNDGSTNIEGSWGLLIGAGASGNIKIGGDAYKTGGGAWLNPSDERLKKDIKNFSDGLEKIMNLNPVYYKFKDASFKGKEYIGFIAQDLEEITPYMVAIRNSNGLEDCRILDESALTKILVNAVKEQQQIIEDLKKRVEDLEP